MLSKSMSTFLPVISVIIISFTININQVIGRMTELDKNDADLDSLEQHLIEEQEENFLPIPLKNMRQIRITDLTLKPEIMKQTIEYYQAVLDEDHTVTNYWFKLFVDKNSQKKQRDLKMQLLRFGLWADCGLVNKMSPPFDQEDQCTESELQYLLDNSE